jgi:F0F1-type ATP synthase delta subunit
MRYAVSNYAKALAEVAVSASARDTEEIRANFLGLLRRTGDGVHLAKVLMAAERFMRAKDGSQRIVVRVARKQKRPVRELVAHLVGPHDAIEEVMDQSLVAGMKVIMNDEREFDGSLKTKLEKLFKI